MRSCRAGAGLVAAMLWVSASGCGAEQSAAAGSAGVAMLDLQADGASEHAPVRLLGELHDRLATFAVPTGLEEYHALILEALARERAVFESWESAGAAYEHRRSIGRDPEVKAASRALRRAYGILKGRYGASGSTANADALFDYHCALDFI